jgi:hypothetical protein
MRFSKYGPMHPAEAALVLLFGATTYSAWLTHIVDYVGDRLWGFLVAGAILFSVGMSTGVQGMAERLVITAARQCSLRCSACGARDVRHTMIRLCEPGVPSAEGVAA